MLNVEEASASDPDVASVAALFADGTRIEMMKALLGDCALPASELARAAGISRSTASGHLDRLLRAGVVQVRRQGRHAYYRLAGPGASAVLESLAVLAPRREPVSPRSSRRASALGRARTCYDHLAGRAGVALADALRDHGFIELTGDEPHVRIDRWDADPPLGVTCASVAAGRRPLLRACLDWSERRHHFAGALAAALTARMFELGWLRRQPGERRIVTVTLAGAEGLHRAFGIDHLVSLPPRSGV